MRRHILYDRNHRCKNLNNDCKHKTSHWKSCERRRKEVNIFQSHLVNSLYQRDLKANTGCVNAAEISQNEEYIASGGDDLIVRLWRTSDCFVSKSPKVQSLKARHESNIFALRFSHSADRIYSAGNDYRIIVHDLATLDKIRIFRASGPVYRIATHPTSDFIIAAASDEGCVHIFDQRVSEGEGSTKLKQKCGAYSVEFCPVSPYLVAVCNRSGLRIYDLRNGRDDYYAEAGDDTKNAICADWSPDGTGLFCIRTRASPLYLNLKTSTILQLNDKEYSNIITVKSCSFAGDRYVVTGSDNWKIFVWRIPDEIEETVIEKAHTILEGHRSVVNHVRYGTQSNLLVSCGVEKIVKCWSNFPLKNSYTEPNVRNRESSQSRRSTIVGTDPNSGSDVEEDIVTLHHFDYYYEHAVKYMKKREESKLNGDISDSDESETDASFLIEDSDINEDDTSSILSHISDDDLDDNDNIADS